MKILIVMDPGILIPVKGYGGHERLVDMFAREYVRMGHEVHLLVTAGSLVQGCTMHAFGHEGFPPKKADAMKAVPVAWKFLWKHRSDFDLVHNFGRLAYLLPILNHPVKKIMTYGREISSGNPRLANFLGSKNLVFTACSGNLLSRVEGEGDWEVVYNAIEFSKYECVESVPEDAPLIFLGRIERIKGCHIAIAVAKACGYKLVIAGNISPLEDEKSYYENEIAPLVDGDHIQYVGALNDRQKNEWLGKARALLFPIEWNEPFGIVMIEAMSCGTPVIAFNRGSVDEVVIENITGLKVNTKEEMIEAIYKIRTINRKACRRYAQNKFDVAIISAQYLGLFNRTVPKIVIVTTGQPAANPRVMKEYVTLAEKGYKVKVLYTYSADWSYKIDQEKFMSGKLPKSDFILVGGNPYNEKAAYFFSRLFFQLSSKLAGLIPLFLLKEITIVRSSMYLRAYTKKYKADVYIAHYLGSLPAAIRAASKYKAAVIFDAEDFHRGEESDNLSQVQKVIAMEDRLLPKVNLITTASPLISSSYQQLYPAKKVITINNVFSKKYLQPAINGKEQKLRLFWFSQSIGPHRGLEVLVDSVNCMDDTISLTLLGVVRDKAYVEQLLKRTHYPGKIHLIGPVSPEQIFNIAADFDIGLAAEIPISQNRDICLTNKIFTYLLAGNCIIASDTAAQKQFMNEHPAVGSLYKHSDAADLCRVIKHFNDNRELLMNCKKKSLELAEQTLNWEMESKKWMDSVESLLLPLPH
ncbi:MAG: glycosyltransferase [Ferruginibacter sp.]